MTPRTLRTASVAIGLLAVSAGVVGASAVGEPTRSYELGPVTVDVNAHTLWRETLDALRCYERHGLSTYGPYPSADGRNIEYAVEATESSEEIEQECLATLMPLGMKFASEAPVVEAEKLIELRSEMLACLERNNAVWSGSSKARPAGTAEGGDRGNEVLQLSSEAHPAETRTCAEALAPG